MSTGTAASISGLAVFLIVAGGAVLAVWPFAVLMWYYLAGVCRRRRERREWSRQTRPSGPSQR